MCFSSVTLAPTPTMNQEFEEGFCLGHSEIIHRISIFKNALKANVVIEALGIFHRSLNDELECKSLNAMMRKLGYLHGVLTGTITLIPNLEGSNISHNVMLLLGSKYSACMMKIMASKMLLNCTQTFEMQIRSPEVRFLMNQSVFY